MSSEQPEQSQAKFGDTVFSNLFETFVEPDLKARIERGELPNPFPLSSLRGVQILFSPEGSKPIVRINSELRAIARVKPKLDATFDKGDPVSFDDIESIDVIALSEEEADYGHATFIRKPNDDWVGYFDFTYYKGTALRHLDVAEQFLHAARGCRDHKHWVAFADTLFSAAELAAKASLYCLSASREVIKTKKHGIVKAHFNKQRHIGNVDDAHTTAFNRLWDLRQKGRYVEDDVAFDDDDADQLLHDVSLLIDAARKRAQPFVR